MANDDYQYSGLSQTDLIRVLKIHPDKPDTVIQCSIEVVEIASSANYTALSYSWGMNDDGDASFSRIIHIDGKRKAITQNLYEGLVRIRTRYANHRLWIDALCIDQSNISERNDQVAKMAEIYKTASRLILWLGEGPSEDEDKLVLNLFRWTEATVSAADIVGGYARGAMSEPARMALHRAISVQGGSSEPVQELHPGSDLCNNVMHVSKVLARFYNRRYYSRRWTCQELWHSSPEKIEILWGPCSYPGLELQRDSLDSNGRQNGRLGVIMWQGLDAFRSDLDGRDEYESMIVSALQHQGYLLLATMGAGVATSPNNSLVKTGYTGTVSTEFTKILHMLPKQYCSDDRDMVFAVASLARDFEFTPDYRLSTVEVYTKFARILVQKGLLDLVLYNLVEPAEEDLLQDIPALPGLPSWVPDLRRTTIRDLYAVYDRLIAEVQEGDLLSCQLYLVGPHERGPSHEQIVSLLMRMGVGSQGAETKASFGYRPGDIVCCTHGDVVVEWNNSGYTLLLRPSMSTPGRFRIVQVIEATPAPEFAFASRTHRIEALIE